MRGWATEECDGRRLPASHLEQPEEAGRSLAASHDKLHAQHAHDYLSRARLEVAKLCEELCPVVYPRSSRDSAVALSLNNHMGWSAIG